jgi:hypothetical protein
MVRQKCSLSYLITAMSYVRFHMCYNSTVCNHLFSIQEFQNFLNSHYSKYHLDRACIWLYPVTPINIFGSELYPNSFRHPHRKRVDQYSQGLCALTDVCHAYM